MHIYIPTVIATMINFLILLIILSKFLFNPVNAAISKRENDISSRMSNARENEKRAAELRTQNENELSQAKHKGKELLEEYRNKAETVSTDIINDAKTEAGAIIERARIEVEREKEKAEDEIRHQVVDLALAVSAKALEETIDKEKHKRLIDDFLAKVGI